MRLFSGSDWELLVYGCAGHSDTETTPAAKGLPRLHSEGTAVAAAAAVAAEAITAALHVWGTIVVEGIIFGYTCTNRQITCSYIYLEIRSVLFPVLQG